MKTVAVVLRVAEDCLKWLKNHEIRISSRLKRAWRVRNGSKYVSYNDETFSSAKDAGRNEVGGQRLSVGGENGLEV